MIGALRRKRGASLTFFCLLPTLLSATTWEEWSLEDADKILECSAILDLLEVADETGSDWPEGVVIDFPVAARVMRERVRLHHGESFTTRRYDAHYDYWSQATPQDPKVAGLEAFLEACRAYGTLHHLPM